MKFKEHLEKLNKLAEEHPESLDADVIYSNSLECNNFDKLTYHPTMGNYNDEDGSYEEFRGDKEKVKINAVSIN